MFKKRSVLAIIVSVIIVGTSTFGTLMYLDRRDFRNYLQNQYLRNLYDLGTNVESLEVSLSKATVTASPKQSLLLFGEIWRTASGAQDKLNALPITHVAIGETSKFLSQVADFSFSLLRANNQGSSLTDAEWNNVAQLRDYSGYLKNQLAQLEQQIADGNIDWGEIKHEGRQLFMKAAQNPVDLQFKNIADSMQNYPTLIYDGPFSENVLNIKPKVLSEPEVSLDQAKEIAANVLGKDRVESISVYSDKTGETIPSYALSGKIKGRNNEEVNLDISKNGGKVVYMLDPRSVTEAKLDMKAAIDRGSKYLQSLGYNNMMPSYSLRYDNIAVVNYIFVRDKVVIYPDQIKLKIALDNGDIVGIESQHYLIAHGDRTLANPRITAADAQKSVSTRINIQNIRLTVIPMESRREVLCYEFYGEYEGEKYIVYINALDGVEERILKVLETENGELTM